MANAIAHERNIFKIQKRGFYLQVGLELLIFVKNLNSISLTQFLSTSTFIGK